MKAVLIKNGVSEKAEDLFIGDFDDPTAGDEEVLVEVKAFGLNRMDILQRHGKYPLPPSCNTPQSKQILGVEFSGIVHTLGGNVTEFKKGDAVFGLVYGGAMATMVAVNKRMIVKKPEGLSFTQAASIPEQWMTAYQAISWVGQFQKGESFLMHAGASGVGTAAVQLARHLGAEHVFATAGSNEKTAFLRQLGCTEAINYKTENYVEVINKASDKGGVNLIVDPVGGDYIQKNIEILARDGRLVWLGMMSGSKREIDVAPVLFKRLTLAGTTLRSRTPEYQGKLLHELMDVALDRFVQGRQKGGFDLVVHKVFPASQIVDATLEMEGGKNTGKIICEW